VAADSHGGIQSSTHPGSGGWLYTAIDGDRKLLDVSCPSASFCAAIDNHSRVMTASRELPLGGRWSAARIDRGRSLVSIACVSRHLCLVTDRGGGVLSSTRPTGGSRTWHRVAVGHGAIGPISCPSAHLCVAVDAPRRLLVTHDPTGSRSAWRAMTIIPRGYDFETFLEDVSCAGPRLCVATAASVGGEVFAWAANHPASRASWHNAAQLDSLSHEGNVISAVSCANPTLCLVVDGTDESVGVDMSDSAAPRHRWSATTYPTPPNYFPTGEDVSCADPGPCVVVTDTGDIITGHRT
jgi:hypothetical protein